MQLTIAILALALSAGFAFWAGVMAWLQGTDDKVNLWLLVCFLIFALATIGFAFLAGRAWQ